MRISLIFILLLGLMISCKQTKKLENPVPSKHLIWADEFNYTGLPDPSKWNYEIGFVRNNEKQYYTKARLENAKVENGNLVITSLKEEYNNVAHYTSASLNTLGKQSFAGDIRIEVNAKLPSGKGIWPAIWMMGTNINTIGWPKCSELDIMEFVGHTPNKAWGTLHWWDSNSTEQNKHKSQGSALMFYDLSSTYHVYGLERRGKEIKLFVDNNYYFTFTTPATAYTGSFVDPLYLLLNTAIGGSWGGDVDDTIFPQKFYIDYVRVYKL
jgi:beta-glucanase (GH16 family)